MKNNPVKLPTERLVKVLGIIPHPVYANVNLPRHRLASLGHIKGDDIRIVVVLQMGLIDFQEGLIRTKDIVHCNKGLAFLAEQGGYKLFEPAALCQREPGIRKMKTNAVGNVIQRHFQKSQKSLVKRN